MMKKRKKKKEKVKRKKGSVLGTIVVLVLVFMTDLPQTIQHITDKTRTPTVKSEAPESPRLIYTVTAHREKAAGANKRGT